jgi:hypothetical protein
MISAKRATMRIADLLDVQSSSRVTAVAMAGGVLLRQLA